MNKYLKVIPLLAVSGMLLGGCAEKSTVQEEVKQVDQEEKTSAKETKGEALYKQYQSDLNETKQELAAYQDVNEAIKAGYKPFGYYTSMVGYLFRNFDIKEPGKTPNVLLYVYEKEKGFVLVGSMWLFPEPLVKGTDTPFKGAKWEFIHEASAHYKDGTELPFKTKEEVVTPSPKTGAELDFWHPDMYGFKAWFNPEFQSSDGPYSYNNNALKEFEGSPSYHPLEEAGIVYPAQ